MTPIWNKFTSIIDKESGNIFHVHKNQISLKTTDTFKNLKDYNKKAYFESFEIDLDDDQTIPASFGHFGSSYYYNESNYLFSIGGFNKNKLIDSIKGISQISKNILYFTN